MPCSICDYDPCICPPKGVPPYADKGNPQNNWFRLIQHFRKDLPAETDKNWQSVRNEADRLAREYLASRLREAADLVQSGGYPAVYGCRVPAPEEDLGSALTFDIGVVLSHPWPG